MFAVNVDMDECEENENVRGKKLGAGRKAKVAIIAVTATVDVSRPARPISPPATLRMETAIGECHAHDRNHLFRSFALTFSSV